MENMAIMKFFPNFYIVLDTMGYFCVGYFSA